MGCGGSKEADEPTSSSTGSTGASSSESKPAASTSNTGASQTPAAASTPPPANDSSDSGSSSGELDLDDEDDEFIKNDPIEADYELGKEIGRGGFSIVVEGTKRDNNEKFAIKCIRKTHVEGDDMKLLKREINIMRKVDHPNILKLFDVYEDEDEFFLVMELVTGKELFDKIVEKGNYTEKDAAHIILQIVSAVDYLHDKGIAHRDLKPENLLSAGEEDEEVIKIADFGFSKNFADEKLMTSCGSPGYVAPEVLTCESYDKSVDMWSVGVIIYILLCGYPPFYADNAPTLFKKIMDVKYDFDDPTWEDVSEAAKDLIRKLLVKEPSQRLTAKQVLEDPWVLGQAAKDGDLGVKTFKEKR